MLNEGTLVCLKDGSIGVINENLDKEYCIVDWIIARHSEIKWDLDVEWRKFTNMQKQIYFTPEQREIIEDYFTNKYFDSVYF